MSLWDALRMNMMISYQELVRTFLKQSQSISFQGDSYTGV
uniref:Uncharacterized protein n=1 Tax=Salmonella enterica subsp. enterica serovar Indiana TaxID=286783 RepID=A0A1C9T7M7_SALET|nr:hypothetical protein [Salmonella enterica subsp. enterica serovar Indiana]